MCSDKGVIEILSLVKLLENEQHLHLGCFLFYYTGYVDYVAFSCLPSQAAIFSVWNL